ncbi:MAG: hypothetical protein AABX85_02375 [Nanoarchaeota archaeon]
MQRIYRRAMFVFSLIFVMIFVLYLVSALSDTMTVEANILTGINEANGAIVRVEVPDYLFFGNVSKGAKSEELKIYVNNTGNVNIIVTPRLANSSEEIFSYLYFRKFKISNGTAVPFSRIGDFSFNITKPSSGNSFNDEYFYVILNLTNYNKTINNNIMVHRADVKFVVVEN